MNDDLPVPGCAGGNCSVPKPAYTTPENDRIRVEVLETLIGYMSAVMKMNTERGRAEAAQEDDAVLANLRVMRDHPNWYFSDGEDS